LLTNLLISQMPVFLKKRNNLPVCSVDHGVKGKRNDVLLWLRKDTHFKTIFWF
jgi:hypothetical protein